MYPPKKLKNDGKEKLLKQKHWGTDVKQTMVTLKTPSVNVEVLP